MRPGDYSVFVARYCLGRKSNASAELLGMVFSSLLFVFAFLPVVLILYFLGRGVAARNAIAVVASLIFYYWGEGYYVLVILASVAVNFLMALFLASTGRKADENIAIRRKRFTITTIAVIFNLALLGYFKYADFFIVNFNTARAYFKLAPYSNVVVHLPLGISFLTFHAISYIVDIYRRVGHAQRNPLKLTLYFTLFPHLIAGPIVRYNHIEAQLSERTTSIDKFATGAERFIFGLCKKVLIANTIAVTVNHIYHIPFGQLSCAVAWYGSFCYALQILFDFSGYSDMAIGMARMLGFEFPENFNYPYIATSMTDFWRRWHMTLSSWFRDYVYIPLGGNRRDTPRTIVNLLTVFFLCGLWHGATWGFVVWGLYHGMFLIFERLGDRSKQPSGLLRRSIQHIYVIATVLVSWVFFRSDSVANAAQYIQVMAGFGAHGANVYRLQAFMPPEVVLAVVIGTLLCTPILPAIMRETASFTSRRSQVVGSILNATGGVAYICIVSLLLLLVSMHLAAGSYNPFIYFRF